ncbi:MAG: hypothetical protein A4E40_01080 [Methanoregulaceae archaeon PtaU1.Bin059]|nr:MAG: hypothetical protein A4E40_01080 [Methanoregulaceae archaeon PtaU1.Bin059]
MVLTTPPKAFVTSLISSPPACAPDSFSIALDAALISPSITWLPRFTRLPILRAIDLPNRRETRAPIAILAINMMMMAFRMSSMGPVKSAGFTRDAMIQSSGGKYI